MVALSAYMALGEEQAHEFNVFKSLATIFGLKKDTRDRVGERVQSVQVIGAGLPRTGTASLRAAFEILEFRSHHMEEVFLNAHHRTKWSAFADGSADFEVIVQDLLDKGFNATVDAPTAIYWRELAARFPDAKVVLSVRDRPEDWANSVTTLHNMMKPLQGKPFSWFEPFKTVSKIHSKLEQVRPMRTFMESEDKAGLAKVYADHVQEVKRTIPAERLLEFNVKQGWKPLCDFLQVPVPSQPFPQVNDGASIRLLGKCFTIVECTWQIPPFMVVMFLLRMLTRACGSGKAKQE